MSRPRSLAALALILAASACASTENTVAFADLNVALRQCREGRAARDELMQTYRRAQEVLDGREKDLIRRITEIEARHAHGGDTSAEQADLKREMVAVQGEYERLQRELTAAELRRADPIHQRLEAILRELARARGIHEVSDSTVAHDGGKRYVDLTADVIRAADAEPARP